MTHQERVTQTVDRMRRNVTAFLGDRIRITRDLSDPDDWTVDPDGTLTQPAPDVVWEGAAVIHEPSSAGDLDRLVVGVPESDVQVGDVVEILQAVRDVWTVGDRWLVDDVDSGSHHVQRRLSCVRRPRDMPVRPDGTL